MATARVGQSTGVDVGDYLLVRCKLAFLGQLANLAWLTSIEVMLLVTRLPSHSRPKAGPMVTAWLRIATRLNELDLYRWFLANFASSSK